MKKVKVNLLPLVGKLNLPTVIKTTVLPGDSVERLFIATQVGEIFYIGNEAIELFLDIRSRIMKLGVTRGGYDERGLLGLAFHPEFRYNGLFYLHYSVAGTQGPGALPTPESEGQGGLPEFFMPDPCNPKTLNLRWTDRENRYDHIDTVEEWMFHPNSHTEKRRTLLNLRRPFFNHNGVNSLNFSPETGMLVLTTGDGGSGYDPFNLSQDDMEIAGKIIEIDIAMKTYAEDPPVVTRFNELPVPIQPTMTVIAKGIRNITGIQYQRHLNHYIKYVGNVGQDLVESIFSFVEYIHVPVVQLVQASSRNSEITGKGFINLGWRGWEGDFPTAFIRDCAVDHSLDEKIIAYYDEALKISAQRIPPLTCYYHDDPRPDRFRATALTGVQPYIGATIPDLTGKIVFTDFAREHMHDREHETQEPVRGVLAYTDIRTDCKLNDYSIIETNYDFGSKSAFYTCLGSNLAQDRLYLGVNSSMNVTDYNQGIVFEIIP